jgi:hypothetical protein
VSGGPYGIEDAVGQGGPLFALIGMVTIPWIWSLPAYTPFSFLKKSINKLLKSKRHKNKMTLHE